MNMKKLLKPMVIAAAATMAFSATAFAGTSSPYSLNINGRTIRNELSEESGSCHRSFYRSREDCP